MLVVGGGDSIVVKALLVSSNYDNRRIRKPTTCINTPRKSRSHTNFDFELKAEGQRRLEAARKGINE